MTTKDFNKRKSFTVKSVVKKETQAEFPDIDSD